MRYDESDPLALLERLRADAAEVIPGNGLFSPEFRSWHAATINVLREQLGGMSDLFEEFQSLQFEWPLEMLQSMHRRQVRFLEDTERQVGSPEERDLLGGMAPALQSAEMEFIANAQEARFRSAMAQACEILVAAITSVRRP